MARTKKRTTRRTRRTRRATRTTRPSAARTMSVDAALRQALEQLRSEREQIDRKIAAIEAAIGTSPAARPASSSATAALPPGRRRRGHGFGGYRRGSVKEYILRVLQNAGGRPMQVKDIADAVVKAGYKTRNRTLAKSVGLALASMPEVEKVGRGAYRLR